MAGTEPGGTGAVFWLATFRNLDTSELKSIGMRRMVSEEDYLFPGSYFIPIELPEEIEQALYTIERAV